MIAEELHVSSQTILNFLRKFPQGGKQTRKRPDIPTEMMEALCSDYIRGASVQVLHDTYGLSHDAILAVFSYLRSRKTVSVRNSMYPSITEWMRSHGYTLQLFAQEIGVPASYVSLILNGKAHMKYETASRIRTLTGLSFKEIFSEVIDSTITEDDLNRGDAEVFR